jgi:DNA-binding transcriptional MerR regulator
MPAPMPSGGPAPDLGGASLTAGRRYLGDLIIETTDVIKPVKHYGVELNEIKILVEKNGFESQESEARTLTSLTEEKKLQLTEPEEIFDGEN